MCIVNVAHIFGAIRYLFHLQLYLLFIIVPDFDSYI